MVEGKGRKEGDSVNQAQLGYSSERRKINLFARQILYDTNHLEAHKFPSLESSRGALIKHVLRDLLQGRLSRQSGELHQKSRCHVPSKMTMERLKPRPQSAGGTKENKSVHLTNPIARIVSDESEDGPCVPREKNGVPPVED